ncbi:MAG: DNA polymerase III subunit beta [Thermus sp.]|uniref:DNA polymerase III subunit beta n=1 Tax=unclassified Thermus TaxID=2619321 RepID=UPI000238A0E7|nr:MULTISPECIES: DNA polymerase III subunit beta [unclassified Thermus]AEV15052.1 DNA polymerase III, beta chain [Thermus sp. CCB_US3_UF1]MCS6868454.1 DNA polymerase III subunit beta [Thermus sp.]MCS7217457.1 DNA polymerase III subunit beta [Thermus sp.]MCX7848802.1 DNA polymerase III subunit beta [Thermus sp.]MDW8016694.1 DNA polymerase III subunit beta [Thermus sp.]
MDVTLPKNLLAEQIALLERVIPSRSSNPMFTYLGLAPQAGGLTLFGSNGEVDLEVHLPAQVQGEGRYLVPAQPFFQLVRSLPGDTAILRLGLDLELSSGSFRTRLSLAPSEGYPELIFPEPGVASPDYPLQTRLPAEGFLRALVHVRYAASNEEYRAIFRGVQLEFSPQGVRAVASDGYRLALYDLPLPQPFQRKAVVPARSVDEVIRVLKGMGEGEAVLALGAGTLGLTLGQEGGGRLRLAVRLMEGEFPDYERVIPKEFPLRAGLEVEPFREALRRVSVLSDRQNHRVDLLFGEGHVLLSAEGDYGKGQEELPVRLEGTPLAVAYNARYLLEALGPLSGQAALLLSGPTSPSLIRPLGEGEGYQAVVVPLRV